MRAHSVGPCLALRQAPVETKTRTLSTAATQAPGRTERQAPGVGPGETPGRTGVRTTTATHLQIAFLALTSALSQAPAHIPGRVVPRSPAGKS